MKINLAVLFGGKTTEHEVSVISALQAIENVDKEKYNVMPVYIDKQGDFYTSKDDILFNSKNYSDLNNLKSKCINVTFVKEKNKTYLRSITKTLFGKKYDELIDVAFPVVHGTNVEDGNLQGYLYTLNLPVVGPDCLAGAVSMDKYVMKEYLRSVGIPEIKALRFDTNDYNDINSLMQKVEKEIGYPVIVKPVNLGSSIGIKKANDKKSLEEALELAFSFANVILVEKAIVNMREINCAVLGDKLNCDCSALEEPFGNDEILSFADKYMSGSKGSKSGVKIASKFGGGAKGGMASLKRKVPADIDENNAEKIKEYAKKSFKYIGLSGVSRFDFIIDKDTNNIYLNEINPIPGSLSFYLFEPVGIKYKDLLDRLINIAINEFKKKEKLKYVFDNNLLK